MDVLSAIKGRRSVRRFLDKPIEPEKLEVLREALIWAPSAGNLQSRRFFFVFNKEIRSRLSNIALNQRFIAEAPLVVVACADRSVAARYGKRGAELYAEQDVACSVQNMMLAAYSVGLGTVWVGAFEDAEVALCLSIVPDLKPSAIIPVGYPASNPRASARVSLEEAIIEIK